MGTCSSTQHFLALYSYILFIVGFLALAWALGISFMLTVTLTVLQLREVLHPDLLAKIIRPQEAHAELLRSLKQESTLTHMRRTCGSMIVYLLILFFFIHIPIQICKCSSLFPIRIKVWYFLPEIQLPVELAIAHIAFLTLLEKKKDLIGHVEHEWFKHVGRILNIERMILPYGHHIHHDGHTSLVPIVRPAPNWDAHNGDINVSRWAWGDEPLGKYDDLYASIDND